ncbi:hypothetical protein OHD52_26655 [Escherichia coli]|nr:hypothetical protein [Escherichia coli]
MTRTATVFLTVLTQLADAEQAVSGRGRGQGSEKDKLAAASDDNLITPEEAGWKARTDAGNAEGGG